MIVAARRSLFRRSRRIARPPALKGPWAQTSKTYWSSPGYSKTFSTRPSVSLGRSPGCSPADFRRQRKRLKFQSIRRSVGRIRVMAVSAAV
jgi:hypothetical protein